MTGNNEPIRVRPAANGTWKVERVDGAEEDFETRAQALYRAQKLAKGEGRAVVVHTD